MSTAPAALAAGSTPNGLDQHVVAMNAGFDEGSYKTKRHRPPAWRPGLADFQEISPTSISCHPRVTTPCLQSDGVGASEHR